MHAYRPNQQLSTTKKEKQLRQNNCSRNFCGQLNNVSLRLPNNRVKSFFLLFGLDLNVKHLPRWGHKLIVNFTSLKLARASRKYLSDWIYGHFVWIKWTKKNKQIWWEIISIGESMAFFVCIDWNISNVWYSTFRMFERQPEMFLLATCSIQIRTKFMLPIKSICRTWMFWKGAIQRLIIIEQTATSDLLFCIDFRQVTWNEWNWSDRWIFGCPK